MNKAGKITKKCTILPTTRKKKERKTYI